MKKQLFAILGLTLALGITACNGNESTPATSNSSESQVSSTSSKSVEPSTSVAPSSSTSSSSASTSSQASTSSSSSSTSSHTHNYGTLNAGYLPSYFFDGKKPYYYCIECGQYFDENKNPTTEEALKLPRATDNIAFLVDGNEKDTFELVEKTESAVSWKITNRGIEKNSVLGIAKPGDPTYKYGFFAGNNVDENNKPTIEGRLDIFLVATPNGFQLSVQEHNSLVVKVNNTEYPMNHVTYLDGTTKTYIYGYHNFSIGDKMTVVDKDNNITYGFSNIASDTAWNKYDFHEGTNNEFVFDKAGRYGIEFGRGGEEEISVTKVFAPANEGTFKIDFVGERADEELTAMKINENDPDLADMKWYITHEAVINADDIKEYVNTHDFYFYYSLTGLEANEEFTIQELTGNRTITAEHLTSVFSNREDVLTLDGDKIKILKDGTYEVGYVANCDSILIYEVAQGVGDVIAMIGGETTSLKKDANGNVSYTFHSNAYGSLAFLDLNGNPLPLTLDKQYDSSIIYSTTTSGVSMVMFLKAGTYSFTYNVTTGVLSLEWTLDDAPLGDNYYYYLSVLGALSGNANRTLSMTVTNGKATVKNVALSVNDLVVVQAMESTTYQSTTYGTLSSDSTPDAFTTFSSYIQVLVAGNYDVSFDLTTTQITITTATN